ncbi:MAG: hypothetical protein Q8900_03825 [Bacillota bacterium]|nr:hypothetical protein [Bacillota bacterium]
MLNVVNKSIDVLVVVDALAAIESGDLGSNVYLMDTNKHYGSFEKGSTELYTSCIDGQNITWRVEAINSDSDVSIKCFSGSMIDKSICVPISIETTKSTFWIGIVEARRNHYDQLEYTITITIDGKDMTFNPFLKVN